VKNPIFHFPNAGGRSILNRTRILLAEDHADMRNIVVRLLEPKFEVVGAVANGRALLDAADKIQPDVLVLDISMPILSGIEAAERLRRAGSTVRIVFLTVHEDPDFVRAAMAAGGWVMSSNHAWLPTCVRQSGRRWQAGCLSHHRSH
jgi:DNA-binding NarL/FixJ family response regulator